MHIAVSYMYICTYFMYKYGKKKICAAELNIVKGLKMKSLTNSTTTKSGVQSK